MFPPNDHSLLALDLQGNFIGDDSHKEAINTQATVWKAASEIFGESFNLFDDKIECDDIKQGSLGNCYFLSSLASLCEFPDLIFQIFRTKEKSIYGYYEIVLFIEGEWQIVIVDDHFPVSTNNHKSFKFCKPNGSELWAALLEKAWAKVNGGYRNTIAGKENEALNALTGFPAERYDTRASVMDRDELWDLVLRSDKASNVMCTTTIVDKSIKEAGLISLHAYTLVGAEVVTYDGKEERLVKIRNPWGNTEWNGRWSDNSELWTDDLKKQVKFENKNDGIFHMNLDDYQKYYNYISVCSIMPKSNVKTFSFPLTKERNSAKVYNINLRHPTTLAIGCVDRHFRFSRELKHKDTGLFIILCRYENDQVEFIDGDFSSNTSVDLIKDLKEGNYLLWVWNDFNNAHNIYEKDGKTKFIKVMFASEDKFFAKEQCDDSEFILLKQIIYTVSVKGKDTTSQPIFTVCENMFKKTGLGYRLIVNNNAEMMNTWENDPTTILGMNMLAYNNTDKFSVDVGPGDWDIFIAARKSFIGKYWFNVKSTYKNSLCQDYTPVHNNNDFYNMFCDESLNIEEINVHYYDYCSPDLSNDQPEFTQTDMGKVHFDDLCKEHPKEAKWISTIPNHPDDSELRWEYMSFTNGSYFGQLNENNLRHGKGVYTFKNGSGYYGQWEKNVKKGKGVSFNTGDVVIYEGEFDSNLMDGQGVFYFTNGDKIEATFVKNMREGPGTYYWKAGNVWKGGFKNNQLHGTGPFTDAKGNTFTITFENGKQKK
eukprot:CAMPEP_0170516292 /NCGR_PEP_ID=MMETSP0209-20121228/2543_1 /TAXON_ID=665100 ORGANISM="Litonotus pictus, Strain P1" /NCGR_SAMPLE_ID=MMETSP0209 /ASSEMBLY_ACC=CAM_ASM_000301 /LENGTH=764 /DNA_ID=CAMNT_0010801111 /DNA_START=96 /DNA_END=2390 /DNA_ORIENTATION=+